MTTPDAPEDLNALVGRLASVLEQGMTLARPMAALLGNEIIREADRPRPTPTGREGTDGADGAGRADVDMRVRWVEVTHRGSDDGTIPVV